IEISFSKSLSNEGLSFACLKNLNKSGIFSLTKEDLSININNIICQYKSQGVLFIGVAVKNNIFGLFPFFDMWSLTKVKKFSHLFDRGFLKLWLSSTTINSTVSNFTPTVFLAFS